MGDNRCTLFCPRLYLVCYCCFLQSQIREEHPLLVTKQTAIARKLGFPEVIMPGKFFNQALLLSWSWGHNFHLLLIRYPFLLAISLLLASPPHTEGKVTVESLRRILNTHNTATFGILSKTIHFSSFLEVTPRLNSQAFSRNLISNIVRMFKACITYILY